MTMVMWSKHTGAEDRSGDGVTSYMVEEWVWKPKPEGGRERIQRIPPPELLRGDPALMRQAISAVPYQCAYSSAVLSFHHDDIDVAAFNAGDPELRAQVDEVIQAFEDTAFVGIPSSHRPPTLWSTHSHTGRLELNVVVPRMVMNGNGEFRSFNPHPPGKESLALWDAFRDTFNSRYGWADPEAAERAQLTKEPNWLIKMKAESERSGREWKVQNQKSQIVGQINEWAERDFKGGGFKDRAGLIDRLKGLGLRINRIRPSYITIYHPNGGPKVRLRGRLFSETFTSPEAVTAAPDAPQRLDLDECKPRFAKHLQRRAIFHKNRYGGPEWEQDPVPAVDQDPFAVERPLGVAMPTPGEVDANAIRPDLEPDEAAKRAYKARLFLVLFQFALSADLLAALRWVDPASRSVHLHDGCRVVDHGERISANRTSALAVHLMILEAQQKGWLRIQAKGDEAFIALVCTEAAKVGIEVTGWKKTMDEVAPRPAQRRQSNFAPSDPDELNRFKREVSLPNLASTLGFAVDGRASDKNHIAMRHTDGTKIIIGRQAGAWVFSSNAGETGSALDLVKWRLGMNLGQARQHLRQWLDPATRPKVVPLASISSPPAERVPANPQAGQREWDSAQRSSTSAYLQKSRGIRVDTLNTPRFADTWRIDAQNNAVFPCLDSTGRVVATERRNRPTEPGGRSFRAYTAGALPGIWSSNASATDTRLIVVESPIDAMAHWQLGDLKNQDTIRYAAIRQGVTPEDLRAMIRSMPVGATIVAACDSDAAGEKYNQAIQQAAEAEGYVVMVERPKGNDWGEDLMSTEPDQPKPTQPRR